MTEPALESEKVRSVIEAILMTAEDPVSPGRLAALFDGVDGKEVRAAIEALKARYEEGGHSFTIVELAGGFQLATRREYGPWVRKFRKGRNQEVRLSQAGLETLAIVAYKQPITRIEVDHIRGVHSGGVIHTLMEHELVRLVGRSEGIGKPMLFGTTRAFLALFGLKSLADLPKPRELEELLADGEGRALEQLGLDLPQQEASTASGDAKNDEGTEDEI